MLIVTILLSVFSVCLFTSHLLLIRELQSIKNQLHEYSEGVEKPIDIVFVNRQLTELASEINKNQTLQKENQLSLVKRECQLKESVSSISHDLRTPLTSMIGYLQLLQKTELNDEQKEYLDISLSRGRYLQTLISDFYDISIWENQNNVPNLAKINLNNLLADTVLSFTEQLEEKRITPSIQFLNAPTYVLADETMLKRIFTNLISNTIRYGRKELKIKVLEEDFVEVIIQNQVESDKIIVQSRLFEKFYTADASRHSSGSGLGLYIVKILSEKMGGHVSGDLIDNKLIIHLSLRKA